MKRYLSAVVVLVLLPFLLPAVGQAANVVTFHCKYAKSAQVDPIVSPGVNPSAHMHDFFGNRNVDENSTASNLAGGPTSCATPGDTAAYWFPQATVGGLAAHDEQL